MRRSRLSIIVFKKPLALDTLQHDRSWGAFYLSTEQRILKVSAATAPPEKLANR